MEAVPSFVARVAVTCTCMRNCGRFCSFYFACAQHFSSAQTPISSNFSTILSSSHLLAPRHLIRPTFAVQDAEEVVLHFCIHFLSPQAAEALQVAAREAREVSVAITCVEPRSPHAQAARGRISSMDLCASRTNRFTYTPTTTGCVYHCASWPEEEEAVQRP